jgi:hypothetical protein
LLAICERQALYIIDGLWYISKNQPFSPREVRDLKRKMQLLEQEMAKNKLISRNFNFQIEKIQTKTGDLLSRDG